MAAARAVSVVVTNQTQLQSLSGRLQGWEWSLGNLQHSGITEFKESLEP